METEVDKSRKETTDTVAKHQTDYRYVGRICLPVLLVLMLSLIHISEPTRLGMISYAVFCLKKKK